MSASCKKPATAAKRPTKLGNGILSRREFTNSRLAEFASEEEPTRLIGHGPEDWLIAASRSLSTMGWTRPSAQASRRLSMSSANGSSASAITDPAWRLRRSSGSSTYSYRTSSNSAYVSPRGGQQIAAPADLEERVRAYLAEHPASPRDETVEALSDAEDSPDDARTEAPR
jgi:hypothetical protein